MSDLHVFVLRPDDLDRRLMREIQSPGSFRWDVRESHSSMAKKLGVDEETVAKRLAKMRASGFFLGYQLIVNPHLLEMEAESLELRVENSPAKDTAISQLKLVEGVVRILPFHGPELQLFFYHRQSVEPVRQISLMESICGSRAEMRWAGIFPRCDLAMTRTDWSILGSLFANPRRRLWEMADEIGVTTRTLNRRMGRMVQGNAFFLDAILNLKKLSGFGCRLLVSCEDPRAKKSVDAKVLTKAGERLDWSNTGSSQYSMFAVHCENTSEAENISRWVRSLSGVKEVRMGIMEEQVNVNEWLREEIRARIAGVID